MMDIKYTKIYARGCDSPLKVKQGHFATNHSHTNYFLDVTTLKTRANEAQNIARVLAQKSLYGTVIDSIVCVEGTEVIGAYLAEELSRGGFLNTNAHKTLYVITPEYNSNSQVMFRDNIKPAIEGKHVLILVGTISTGKTVNRLMEAIKYYGGNLAGVSAIFSDPHTINGIPTVSVFNKNDLADYTYSEYHDCPMCKEGQRLDGLVNAFGISLL